MTETTYRVLVEPLAVRTVNPRGLKRPIQTFPAVGRSTRGLASFQLHLAGFLEGIARGPRNESSSLHEVLDTTDDRRVSEILHRVVHEEIPRTYGKYLDEIRSFEVTIHRETFTLSISAEMNPHGAESVSWSFEVHFKDHPNPTPSPPPQVLTDTRAAELSRVAHHYYPFGFPLDEDDDEEPVPAYQRTPEFLRWQEAWEKSLAWKEWKAFIRDARADFAGLDLGDVTAPYRSACRRCCIYLRNPLPDGGQLLTRVAGAVSVLAPLYLVYTTTQTLRPDKTWTRPKLHFALTGEAKPHAEKLAQHIEKAFGYRPFPMELADAALPDLRIGDEEHPTLLQALLAGPEHLENLP